MSIRRMATVGTGADSHMVYLCARKECDADLFEPVPHYKNVADASDAGWRVTTHPKFHKFPTGGAFLCPQCAMEEPEL